MSGEENSRRPKLKIYSRYMKERLAQTSPEYTVETSRKLKEDIPRI
jgi:hypothetical protein